MTDSYNQKLAQLQAMGYNPVVSRNALEAADGDVEAAMEIILADETNEINSGNAAGTTTSRSGPATIAGTSDTAGFTSFEGKKAKDVIDQWSQQLLGDKHPEVKARAQEAGKSAKQVWSSAMSKLKSLDEKHSISTKAKDAVKTCDQKMRAFDQKHEWTKNANQAADYAGSTYQKSVESAKRSLAEQRQDVHTGN